MEIILGGGQQLSSLFHHLITQIVPERLKKEDDKWILGTDTDELVDYLAQEYYIPPLELDPDRPATPRRITSQVEYESFGGRVGTTDQNRIEMTIYFRPHKNLDNSLMFEAPTRVLHAIETEYDESDGSVRFTTTPNELERDVDFIKGLVDTRNPAIVNGNSEIKNSIRAQIEERKKKLSEFENEFEGILQKINIPLKTRESSEVPIVDLKLRRQVEELRRPIVNPKEEFVLDKKYVNQILEVLENSGLQFELNPVVFGKLEEEEMRDIMLAHLNAIFEGNATGETFSKLGKTDIHLKIQKGEIFIGECKFWGGEKLFHETIDQLFRYLTWRRNFSAVIIFSKNAGFTDVLNTVEQAISKHPTYSSGLQKIKDGHFQAIHKFPEDAKKEVEVHYLIFNLNNNK